MKHFIRAAFVAALVLMAGYGVYTSQQEPEMSDLAIANVEALANSEWDNGERITCWAFIVSPQPDELQNGTQYPIVIDCEPCGNLVIAKEASGQTRCTYYKP